MRSLAITITVILCLSGKADNVYNRTQKKVDQIQKKIEEVQSKIYDLQIKIDSLGFIKE